MSALIIKTCRVKTLKAQLITPFRTALGEHESLENMAFEIELSDGTKGNGEAAVAPHITGETLEQTRANLEKVSRILPGQAIADYPALGAFLRQEFAGNMCAVAAVETALMDALTRHMKIPLWKFFGDNPKKLSSDITIVINSLEETALAAKDFYKRGFRCFKVKIGRDMDLDIKRVAAVRKITRHSPIILDANQGYSARQTLKFLEEVKRLGVRPALIEQPVPKADWEGLKKISEVSDVPVCADESAGNLKDIVRIISEKAARVINIKIMKFGLLGAREAALLARAAGLDLMVGGMMESPLAMTASAHLAAGLGFFKYVDLDTPFFIKNPVRVGGLRQKTYLDRKGVYYLSQVKAGIGLEAVSE